VYIQGRNNAQNLRDESHNAHTYIPNHNDPSNEYHDYYDPNDAHGYEPHDDYDNNMQDEQIADQDINDPLLRRLCHYKVVFY
jgi:hypothetical protein